MVQKRRIVLIETVMILATLAVASCSAVPAKEVIATTAAPAAIGPYSQAVKSGNLLFLSGQIAIDPRTNQFVTGSVEEQTRRVLENLKAVLAANNMTLEHVVSTTIFLKDMKDFAKVNAVYATFFTDKPPARATVEVSGLPKGALVEISAVAAR